ncbi:beta-1,4-glucuronyltransferase 1-like isoform X2 [Denticeps clupeoides]|uniref:beta-1,4-glucuronyltransferase 1-like isoform X2 n=2 Tax=Denticeps clupeoides TaxID=299321 RepID=UPI0010A349D0|nr:beta-1,4-glucuronyltransferase 1-like isoform X2 [Denticeps clupeoides]
MFFFLRFNNKNNSDRRCSVYGSQSRTLDASPLGGGNAPLGFFILQPIKIPESAAAAAWENDGDGGVMRPCTTCSAFRLVLGALLVVALLQLLYLSFLSGLHGRQQRSRYSELFGAAARRPDRPSEADAARLERLRYALSAGGAFDASGQYRVYKNLIRSEAESERPLLALATHASVSNLHHLDSLLGRWRHRLSVAVFAHGRDVGAAAALLYALGVFCPHVRALVDFHLVCGSGEAAGFPERDREQFAGLEDCAGAFGRLEARRDEHRNYAIGANVSYPNNLLRNVARGGVDADYVLVLDVDMAPSADLHRRFADMAARRRPAADEVLVLPAFEIRHAGRLPAAKPELLRLYQVGEVRPFYEELCPRCQAPTDYSRWLNLPGPGAGPLGVAYTLTWADPWEPFYIGARSVPPYDERFRQYGFNRISQSCGVASRRASCMWLGSGSPYSTPRSWFTGASRSRESSTVARMRRTGGIVCSSAASKRA